MWEYRREQIGALDCGVVTPTASRGRPQALALFCHGFGAPGDDLIPIAEELLDDERLSEQSLAFVFPVAPIPLDPGGMSRAWWPIDMVRLQMIAESSDITGLADLVPSRLATCRELVNGVVDEFQRRWEISAERTVVGGFSQGAMLATEVALHATAPLGGLVAWSGALINQTEWRKAASSRPRMKVVQSHGLWDPILPFATGEALRDLLQEAGHEVEFVSFQGYHSIPPGAINACRQLLLGVLA